MRKILPPLVVSFLLIILGGILISQLSPQAQNVNVGTTPTAGWSVASNGDAILTLAEPTPSATTSALVATGTGNCTNGAHLFRTTYVTANGQTVGGSAAASVTCDGTHKQVTVTIPTGSPFVTGRNVYATKAGGSTYFLVATSPVVNDNSTVTYTFNIADGSFTATTLSNVNTAREVRLRVNPTTGAVTPGLSGSMSAAQLVIASQAAYDILYAASATAWTRLGKGSTGQIFRQTASTPSWSTATLPDTFVAGDLVAATATNTLGSIADAAVGQVLTSGGVGVIPTFSASPSVTSLTVKLGTGSGTVKASGIACQDVTNPDTATQNAWNYKTCTIPAAALASTGDTAECVAAFRFASNTNTKAWQLYWNGGTCSGSSAAACASGDSVFSNSTTGSAIRTVAHVSAVKTGTNTQALYDMDITLSTAQALSAPGTATESSAIPVVLAYRNESASAATTNTNIAPILVCSVKNF